MKVSAPESDDYIALPINYENLVKHKYFVQEVDKIYWNHQFQKESDRIMEEIYEKISHYDGRSMVPNVLVRNLIIALNLRKIFINIVYYLFALYNDTIN